MSFLCESNILLIFDNSSGDFVLCEFCVRLYQSLLKSFVMFCDSSTMIHKCSMKVLQWFVRVIEVL